MKNVWGEFSTYFFNRATFANQLGIFVLSKDKGEYYDVGIDTARTFHHMYTEI